MTSLLSKKLFFSMTYDFLTVYIPQDSASSKTVKTYRDGLTIFRRYVAEVKGFSIRSFSFSQCTFAFVLEYRNWLLDDQKRAKSTVNNRLAAIKSYMYYAAAKDISLQQIQINIAAVPFLQVEKSIRPVIENPETLKALLNAPPNTKTGCRDVMILSVLFNTMIRADELIKLDIGDVVIDSDIPFLKIQGKGGKERMAPLAEEAIPLIKTYLAEYHGSRPANNTPFIYTVQHGHVSRMSERNVERIVKKYAAIIRDTYPDLPRNVYPHMLRRTHATGLYRDGVAVEAIASALGHASIQTTKDHYAFPSLVQKQQVVNAGGVVIAEPVSPEWPDDEEELARICGLR